MGKNPFSASRAGLRRNLVSRLEREQVNQLRFRHTPHNNPRFPELERRGQNRPAHGLVLGLLLLCSGWSPMFAATERELIRDPHFQNGFFLLEPTPGKRVVYGELVGPQPGKPAWDLAQWSSRSALAPGARLCPEGERPLEQRREDRLRWAARPACVRPFAEREYRC